MMKLYLTHFLAFFIGVSTSAFVGYQFIMEKALRQLVERTYIEHSLVVEAAHRMSPYFLLITDTEDLRRDLEIHLCRNASQIGETLLALDHDEHTLERVIETRKTWATELEASNVDCPQAPRATER